MGERSEAGRETLGSEVKKLWDAVHNEAPVQWLFRPICLSTHSSCVRCVNSGSIGHKSLLCSPLYTCSVNFIFVTVARLIFDPIDPDGERLEAGPQACGGIGLSSPRMLVLTSPGHWRFVDRCEKT